MIIKTAVCDFCKKTEKEVEHLIAASNNVYICNECVSKCVDVLNEIKNTKTSYAYKNGQKMISYKFKEERSIKAPSIYKHFKGKIYITIGMSEPTNVDKDGEMETYLKAMHTKTDKQISVMKDLDGGFYHDVDKCSEILVLYKSVYDDTDTYILDPWKWL